MLARASLLACLLPLTAAAQQTITLPAYTLIALRMTEPLSSDRLQRGYRFGSHGALDDDIRLEIDSGETYFVACARGARSSTRLNCAPSNRRMFDLTKETLRKAT